MTDCDPGPGANLNVSENSYVRCPQFNIASGGVMGQEDCLMLNVYVPEHVYNNGADNPTASVMVWITGGALLIGSNEYGQFCVMGIFESIWVKPDFFGCRIVQSDWTAGTRCYHGFS